MLTPKKQPLFSLNINVMLIWVQYLLNVLTSKSLLKENGFFSLLGKPTYFENEIKLLNKLPLEYSDS